MKTSKTTENNDTGKILKEISKILSKNTKAIERLEERLSEIAEILRTKSIPIQIVPTAIPVPTLNHNWAPNAPKNWDGSPAIYCSANSEEQ